MVSATLYVSCFAENAFVHLYTSVILYFSDLIKGFIYDRVMLAFTCGSKLDI